VSSLGLSLLLLMVLAVGVALLYNLRQSRPRPRWSSLSRWPGLSRWRGLRSECSGSGGRSAPDSVGAAASGAHASLPGVRVEADDCATPARGEPRLGTEAFVDDMQRGAAGADAAAAPAHARPATSTPEVAAAPVANAADATVLAMADPGAARARLSEIVDCIVELSLPAPCSDERLAEIAQHFRRAGSKPVIVEGRSVDGVPADWGGPGAAREYAALRAGILMANRHGPLNAMEFSEFVAGVQAIAGSLAALPDTPDMSTVLARARDLDATCAQLDAQIGLNVEAPEAIAPAQLAGLAGILSMVERGSHRYARLGPQGELVFSVALSDVPSRFTFLLDVPRSMPASDAWGQMLEAARTCAQRVGGRLVDDDGRALPDAALAQIGRQLIQRYESLEAIGLPAGSALTLRVFN